MLPADLYARHAHAEAVATAARAALADTLVAVGPDAPTLCEGWDAHDLAAHLVVREARPDAGLAVLGERLPAAAAYGRRLLQEYRRRPFTELVQEFRAGPPRTSAFRLRALDGLANSVEYTIHHEDVLRAQPGPQPRTPTRQPLLWQARAISRVFFRSAPVGVLLAVDADRVIAKAGVPRVIVRVGPVDLLLLMSGRAEHAGFEVDGGAEQVASFDTWLAGR